jgi:DNA-binding transcriptional regulator YdaS (Cro superfamily)
MRKSKTIKINDKEIVAWEITVSESQNYIENLSNDEGSFIDLLFPDSLPASLIKLCTKLTEDELLAFYPSEIEEIINAVEEVNPTTASRIKKLAEIGRKALEIDPDLLRKLQEKGLNQTAAD